MQVGILSLHRRFKTRRDMLESSRRVIMESASRFSRGMCRRTRPNTLVIGERYQPDHEVWDGERQGSCGVVSWLCSVSQDKCSVALGPTIRAARPSHHAAKVIEAQKISCAATHPLTRKLRVGDALFGTRLTPAHSKGSGRTARMEYYPTKSSARARTFVEVRLLGTPDRRCSHNVQGQRVSKRRAARTGVETSGRWDARVRIDLAATRPGAAAARLRNQRAMSR